MSGVAGGIPGNDERDIAEQVRLTARSVYAVVAEEGEEELERPLTSLWWSGIAAGLAISASLHAQGFLKAALPDTEWAGAVIPLGYTVGFLIVVLGRLQLFTENTLTAVLPLLASQTMTNLWRTLRLWGVVLVANLVGTLVSSSLALHGSLFSEARVEASLELAREFAGRGPLEHLFPGIPAGFLVAAMVWMLPSVEGAGSFWTVFTLAYVIAVGGLSHVIVGSTDVFLLQLNGELGLLTGLGIILFSGLGNVVGGTGLFALLAYAQVKEEIED